MAWPDLSSHNLNSKIYNISSRKFKSVLHPSNNQTSRQSVRPSISPTHTRGGVERLSSTHPQSYIYYYYFYSYAPRRASKSRFWRCSLPRRSFLSSHARAATSPHHVSHPNAYYLSYPTTAGPLTHHQSSASSSTWSSSLTTAQSSPRLVSKIRRGGCTQHT